MSRLRFLLALRDRHGSHGWDQAALLINELGGSEFFKPKGDRLEAGSTDFVEKLESGYAKVQTDLTIMRRSGDLPYDWIANNTRWQRKPRTFDSVEEALRETARFYRKSLCELAAHAQGQLQ